MKKIFVFGVLALGISQAAFGKTLIINCSTKQTPNAVTIEGEVSSVQTPILVTSLKFQGQEAKNFSLYNPAVSKMTSDGNLALNIHFNKTQYAFENVAISLNKCGEDSFYSYGDGYIGGMSYRYDLDRCTCQLK